MTEEQINIAIAEECGWKRVEGEECFFDNGIEQIYIENIPDYCNDLNAMHEAEKVLSEKQQREYSFRLLHALVDGSVTNDLNDHFIFLSATAIQRAKAFLKAKRII